MTSHTVWGGLFPFGSLPPTLANAVDEAQRNIQAPTEMVFCSAMAALALAAQDLYDVRLPKQEKTCPVSLFLAVLGESGERKSAVDGLFFQPVNEFERENQKVFDESIRQFDSDLALWKTDRDALTAAYKTALKKQEDIEVWRSRLREHIDLEPQRPKRMRLTFADATPEALLKALNDHPSVALTSDEGQNLLKAGLASDFGALNSLWSGKRVTVDRVSADSVIADNVRVSINLVVQPTILGKFNERKGDEARGSGFWSRFLVAYPISRKGFRQDDYLPHSWDRSKPFFDRIRELLQSNPRPRHQERDVIEFSEDAKKAFIDMTNAFEMNIAKPFGPWATIDDYVSKLGENVARIAALFHILEKRSGPISREHLQCAEAIGRFFVWEFGRLFTPPPEISEAEKLAYDLEKWLRQRFHDTGICGWRNRDLMRGVRSLRDAESRDLALMFLHSRGRVIVTKDENTEWVYLQLNFLNQDFASRWRKKGK